MELSVYHVTRDHMHACMRVPVRACVSACAKQISGYFGYYYQIALSTLFQISNILAKSDIFEIYYMFARHEKFAIY